MQNSTSRTDCFIYFKRTSNVDHFVWISFVLMTFWPINDEWADNMRGCTHTHTDLETTFLKKQCVFKQNGSCQLAQSCLSFLVKVIPIILSSFLFITRQCALDTYPLWEFAISLEHTLGRSVKNKKREKSLAYIQSQTRVSPVQGHRKGKTMHRPAVCTLLPNNINAAFIFNKEKVPWLTTALHRLTMIIGHLPSISVCVFVLPTYPKKATDLNWLPDLTTVNAVSCACLATLKLKNLRKRRSRS